MLWSTHSLLDLNACIVGLVMGNCIFHKKQASEQVSEQVGNMLQKMKVAS